MTASGGQDCTTEPPTAALGGLGGLSWRPLLPGDLDLWYGIVSEIQDHDEERERQTRADLGAVLSRPSSDLAVTSAVGLDATGAARAWARHFARRGQDDNVLIHLTGGVDPSWRRRGVGRDLLRWQIARAAAMAEDARSSARHEGRPPPEVHLGRFVEEQVPGSKELFRGEGFEPARWFTELRRALPVHDQVVAVELPPSVRLRPYEPQLAGRCAAAFNAAFAGQWGTTTHTSESWTADVESDEAFRADLSYVCVDVSLEAEPVVALVVNAEYEEDWPAQGYTEGYTEYVAVVPTHRGRGLATQLLQLTAQECTLRKHDYATLAVDADNPTSAGALYEKLGYRPHHVTIYFARRA